MLHWKIHHRLLGCFALVTVLLIALSAYSVFVTQGIDTALTANSSQNAVIQRAAIDFRGSVHDRAIALRDAVIAQEASSATQEVQEIERLAQATNGPISSFRTCCRHKRTASRKMYG